MHPRVHGLILLAVQWSSFIIAASAFRCNDGSSVAELPEEVVNDDFCDCVDGSDEPDTDACAGQDATLYLCVNTGSTPQEIYSSRVRDGICDCCDGSDERPPASTRPAILSCPDTCVEQGIRQKAEREERANIVSAGLVAQKEILRKARGERKNWRSELARLETALPALEAEYDKLRLAREANEAREAAENSANATDENATAALLSSVEEPAAAVEVVAEEKATATADNRGCYDDPVWQDEDKDTCEVYKSYIAEGKITVDEACNYGDGVAKIYCRKTCDICQAQEAVENLEAPTDNLEASPAEKPQVSEYTKWMDGAQDAGSSGEARTEPEVKVVSEYAAWMEGAEEVIEGREGTSHSTQFVATVAKKEGRLGMALTFENDLGRVSEVMPDEAADIWNKQEGQKDQIRKDDCILKANNVEVRSAEDFKKNVDTDPVSLLVERSCEESLKALSTTTTTTQASASGEKEDPEELDAKAKVKTRKDRIEELNKHINALDDSKLTYNSLVGTTLEKKVAEHDYKITFFDKAMQGYTSLGGSFEWTGSYSGKFSGGSTCWQGPARTLSVDFECGVEAELLDVSEPSRCTYAAAVAHPGACNAEHLETLANPPTRRPHDEF